MENPPETFARMLAAWNEPTEEALRVRAEQVLSDDVIFCDPHYDIRGIEAWVQMVLRSRKSILAPE